MRGWDLPRVNGDDKEVDIMGEFRRRWEPIMKTKLSKWIIKIEI